MSPHWLDVLGWISLGVAGACALVILVDELLLGHRQQMWIMNIVHPVTALYLGPVWLWAYFTRGRRLSVRTIERRAREIEREGGRERVERAAASDEVSTWNVASAVSHCGAGCTLGDSTSRSRR